MIFRSQKQFGTPFLTTTLLAIVLLVLPILGHAAITSSEQPFAQLEQQYGGRLGVYAIDTQNQKLVAYHADELFPLCSTAKVMVVANILQLSMSDSHLLTKRIRYPEKILEESGYAPITKKYLHVGMTIKHLSQATLTDSDNAAANLLIQKLGGTKAVTTFAHSIGNDTFRLDRKEPALNSAIPGDPRDTATPQSMAMSLEHLVLGNTLGAKQSELLKTWLIENKTGNNRVRAALPSNWTVGDKTGTGGFGTTNDIAIIWPPNCRPLVLAIYYTQTTEQTKPNEPILVKATRLALGQLAEQSHCLRGTR